MVFYFSGTGNSKYAAQRIAEALDEPLLSLNERIKAGDTTPVKVELFNYLNSLERVPLAQKYRPRPFIC